MAKHVADSKYSLSKVALGKASRCSYILVLKCEIVGTGILNVDFAKSVHPPSILLVSHTCMCQSITQLGVLKLIRRVCKLLLSAVQ